MKTLCIVMLSRSPGFMAVEYPGLYSLLCISYIVPELRGNIVIG